jgi:hypothetical protein
LRGCWALMLYGVTAPLVSGIRTGGGLEAARPQAAAGGVREAATPTADAAGLQPAQDDGAKTSSDHQQPQPGPWCSNQGPVEPPPTPTPTPPPAQAHAPTWVHHGPLPRAAHRWGKRECRRRSRGGKAAI